MSQPFFKTTPTENMQKFNWSASKLASFAGNLDWKDGCGVKLYLDNFAGPTIDIRSKAFSFGNYIHEVLENYHEGAEAPDYEAVLRWQKECWISKKDKKSLLKNYGPIIAEKWENNEPVGIKDFHKETLLTAQDLEAAYPHVDICQSLLKNEAYRWMFLGYTSAEEEKEYQDVAKHILNDYMKRTYIKPVEREQRMVIQMGGATIIGFIDRVDAIVNKGHMQYCVVDYKTSKKMKTSAELEKDFQMICYHNAVKAKYKVTDEMIEVGLLFLKPEEKNGHSITKKPITFVSTRITPEITKRAEQVIAEAARRVKEGIFHYVAHDGMWQCPYCAHYKKCGREKVE